MSGARPPVPAAQPGSRRVVVAMSGGVDSSVAAALLKQQGHEVIGVTLQFEHRPEAGGSRSCGADAVTRARTVAGQLDIPHHLVDCADEFERQVLRPAWEEYARGRTPSPCLRCNERIKFGVLLAWARRFGASALATGHYVRVEVSAEGAPFLLRGLDPEKDQSYFLAGLDREQLLSVAFPLGGLTKAAVRALARSLGLATAEAQESQDACLVGASQSFADVLRERFSAGSKAGVILHEMGHVLGRHSGIHHFTVGQRRGLAVSWTSPLWVKAIRTEDGAVVVTDRAEGLLGRRFFVREANWTAEWPRHATRECEVQIRYRHAAQPATVSRTEDDTATVCFHEPVRAITPGQAAVFYAGERVLGRGWIDAG